MSARATRSTPRLVVGLIAAGLVAFAALLLLLAYRRPDRGRRATAAAHALSVSAIGFKGLVDAGRRASARPA